MLFCGFLRVSPVHANGFGYRIHQYPNAMRLAPCRSVLRILMDRFLEVCIEPQSSCCHRDPGCCLQSIIYVILEVGQNR